MATATRPPRGLRRVYKYGFFTGLGPVCPGRVREYPELAAVRDASPAQRQAMDPGDLEDAQHQWVYTSRTHVMQECYDCDAVRPVPLAGYPEEAQVFILQQFINRSTQMKEGQG